MAATSTAQGVLVTADARYWWAPLARWVAGSGVVGLIVSVGVGVDEGDWSFAGIPVIAAVVGLPLGLVHALLWVRPARVSYEVRGDTLFARRGQRTVREWPCADVEFIRIAEEAGVGWEEVISSNSLSYNGLLPASEIEIRAKSRWDPHAGIHGIPTILVWGEENARRATELLNAAVRQANVPDRGA